MKHKIVFSALLSSLVLSSCSTTFEKVDDILTESYETCPYSMDKLNEIELLLKENSSEQDAQKCSALQQALPLLKITNELRYSWWNVLNTQSYAPLSYESGLSKLKELRELYDSYSRSNEYNDVLTSIWMSCTTDREYMHEILADESARIKAIDDLNKALQKISTKEHIGKWNGWCSPMKNMTLEFWLEIIENESGDKLNFKLISRMKDLMSTQTNLMTDAAHFQLKQEILTGELSFSYETNGLIILKPTNISGSLPCKELVNLVLTEYNNGESVYTAKIRTTGTGNFNLEKVDEFTFPEPEK